ncbi:MAG TPA: glutaredoxin domain-containing protein [Oligoflexia bacterium]|nr:glutaredoxin domain-containing protein [Oligoflexia bacterium]HMR24049.1 glutaredoxin domain-containing protein [Oligoflexia bacterium]
MSHALTLYYNPSCSKCQKAVELLDQLNYAYHTIDYLENGLTQQEVHNLIRVLNLRAEDIIRKDDLKKYDLSPDILLNHESIVATISKKPALLQRPILLFKSEIGIIARPPEKIIAFLKSLKA